MATDASRRPAEKAGRRLHYVATRPAGLSTLLQLLLLGALSPLVVLAMNAGAPLWAVVLPMCVIASFATGTRRRVALTEDGRLLVSGAGQHVDVDAARISAVTVSRRARMGFGSAVVHWDGGRFPIWQVMQYTRVPRSLWSPRAASGHGKDFGDLVYRLRVHNPALVIEGVDPPIWAQQPPAPPLQPPWW